MGEELSEAGALDILRACEAPKSYRPADADVLLLGSPSLMGRLIRWALSTAGEPARVNHVGLVCAMTPARTAYLRRVREYEAPPDMVGQWVVLEAVGRGVVATPLGQYYKLTSKPGYWLVFGRRVDMPPGWTSRIVAEALGDVGRRYSVARLLAWGLDHLVGSKFAGALGPDELVCSTYAAAAYMAAGICPIGDRESPHQVSPEDWWAEMQGGEDWDVFAEEWPENGPGPAIA